MKVLKYALLASTVFAMASCSSDAPEINGNGDGNVTFTLQVPGNLATRAFGDGKSALNLQYAVYEENGTEAVITSLDGSADQVKFEAGALSTNVTLQLVNGKSYEIIFWADNENAPYTFDATTKSITLDYNNLKVNDETRDAFYAVETTGKITGPISKTIRLTRPFAQVNLGSNDLQNEEVKRVYENNIYTSASVTASAYTTLNLSTGAVSNPVAVNFAADALPTGETFRVEGYDLMQMNYILVPQDESSLADFTFNFHIGTADPIHSITVPNVPLQANYRTNIYGSLLTTTADYTIVKDPIFDGDDYNVPYVGVENADELKDALNQGKRVILEDNLALDAPLVITNNAIINGNGKTISGAVLQLTGEIAQVSDVKFANPTNEKNNASNLVIGGNKVRDIVIDGCTFEGTQWDALQITPLMPNGVEECKIVIRNSKFVGSNIANTSKRGIHIQFKSYEGDNLSKSKIFIEGNEFQNVGGSLYGVAAAVFYFPWDNVIFSNNVITGELAIFDGYQSQVGNVDTDATRTSWLGLFGACIMNSKGEFAPINYVAPGFTFGDYTYVGVK